ncbi:MAG: hypothetical protein QOJ21_183 [Solirubrobacteraceae bacterium]|nr:hypothetical protein [Solirubrobacteraceae bacterium]
MPRDTGAAQRGYSSSTLMAVDVERTARGALAGAVAAGVWAAQSPMDCRVFGVRYLDEELLGKAVTRGSAWRGVGLALHVVNGAVFGAVYASIAPRLPLPAWARGPAAGIAEHLAGWPLTVLADRFHPARDELPSLAGNGRAFAQATWRHLVFGVVLGELERRLRRPDHPSVTDGAPPQSSNGHGDIRRAAGVGGAIAG